MDINYDWLFSFEVFAARLSFTRAAAELHISQPALHVQIKKLTEAIGTPLYIRRGRALVLTIEGQRLAAHATDVREQGRDLVAELRGETLHGPVVLASGQGAFIYLLATAIRRFQRRYPLRLVVERGPALVEAVRTGTAHLAVIGGYSAPDDLRVCELRRVGQQVIVPRRHRLARRRRVRPRDLADEEIIVAPKGSPHREMLQQLLGADDVRWSVAVEASGWELMLHFARCGVGVAVVNDFCSVPRGMTGIPLQGAPAVSYYLLARRHVRQSEGVQILSDLVRETASFSA